MVIRSLKYTQYSVYKEYYHIISVHEHSTNPKYQMLAGNIVIRQMTDYELYADIILILLL